MFFKRVISPVWPSSCSNDIFLVILTPSDLLSVFFSDFFSFSYLWVPLFTVIIYWIVFILILGFFSHSLSVFYINCILMVLKEFKLLLIVEYLSSSNESGFTLVCKIWIRTLSVCWLFSFLSNELSSVYYFHYYVMYVFLFVF